jgi:hypothetical protein
MSDLAAAFEAVLPRQSGYGHVTAAALRGWWLPWLPVDLPLLATTTSGVHVQRPGLYVRRSLHTSMVQSQPMSLVDPASCLLEMAVDLALVDMVPLVDIALRTGCTVDEIRAAAWPGRRGARTLRRALALSDPRSESAWESILRLLHVLERDGSTSTTVLFTVTRINTPQTLHARRPWPAAASSGMATQQRRSFLGQDA